MEARVGAVPLHVAGGARPDGAPRRADAARALERLAARAVHEREHKHVSVWEKPACLSAVFIFVAAFLASAVEMVEALTIVLAVGVVRGWRSPLVGVGARRLVLAVVVGGARAGADADPDQRAAARGRRAAARLRPAVAAQGDPARERLQGAARRGRDLRAGARRGPSSRARRARRPRLVRVHALLQGRAPGGARGRVHRRSPSAARRAGSPLAAAAPAPRSSLVAGHRRRWCARRSAGCPRTRSSSRSA